MPEGPEIRRAADKVERALAGRRTSKVEFAFARLARFEKQLSGRTVKAVETRGKAMLTHFSGGLSIYSHNQLYGVWIVKPAGQLAATRRSLRLAIHNEKKSALLYSASEIDVLETRRLDAHPFLAKLGPDALSPTLTDADLDRHIAQVRFAGRPLHALLLDQSFVAGIGNYLRSEILFVAGLHPMRRTKEMSDAERQRLAREIRRITRRAYRTGGITNDEARARSLRAEGVKRRELRHHVFTREGLPCWTCGEEVIREVLAGRKIFRCPHCQPAA